MQIIVDFWGIMEYNKNELLYAFFAMSGGDMSGGKYR